MTGQTFTDIVRVDHGRAVTDSAFARSYSKKPGFCVYSERFTQDCLGTTPKLTLVEQRDYQFAHEAGVYVRPTNSVYFTANFQTCDPVHLYAIDSATHKITQLDFAEVVQANGACNYQDGVLYCSQGDRNTPSGLVHVDPVTAKSETLINNFYGRDFNSVNDVVIHHETGEIWFTDPNYGYHQGFRPASMLPPQVYRFNPETKECWMVADGFVECNGLCFSPDYKLLYVTDTGAIQAHAGPGDGHQFSMNHKLPGTIYVYDVVNGRELHNRRVFAFCAVGIPDGIKCDEKGYVYSGCGDGVHCWAPDGTLVGKIVTGGVTANFCFAKEGMWLFAEKDLFFCELGAKGCLVKTECE
ncbi:hypothetical protein LTS17_000632 [Exophiala oligosperma]